MELLDLVNELVQLNDDNLAQRVINDNDVQWCLSELQDILSADVAPEWISVKEWLPENEKMVILLQQNGQVHRAEVRKFGRNLRFRCYSDASADSPITHWIPFPAIPQKGEADD